MVEKLKLFVPLAFVLIVWNIPTDLIPIENLSTIEHRVICLFLLAASFWILEPIPVYATSVLIIVLELILISDNGLEVFRANAGDPAYGTELSYRSIMATFASPIILLFMGGFFLAIAGTKYRLDLNLARVLLRPFGHRPEFIMLGMMLITAVFSMFMSNTATTAMMIAVIAPVLTFFAPDDRGQTAFVLAIPFAANIGGLGTPIGTPPNAIALKYLSGDIYVSFAQWMMFGVPYVMIMILFTWVLLLMFYKPKAKRLNIDIKEKFNTDWKSLVVYTTFSGTIVLWLTGHWHGMNSYVVAMFPVGIFSVTQIINREDLKLISWDVLWLVAGGIALGTAMEDSGLSKNLIASVPFEMISPVFIVVLFTLLAINMATFMSNTAAANLVLPIVTALGMNMEELAPYGGSKMLILATTFASSLAMSLVISTPPNAIAFASGKVKSHQLLLPGFIIGTVGLLMLYIMIYVLFHFGFFPTPGPVN